MEYRKIVAVSGLPGLYELLNSKTDGAIVRSLDDKSSRFVSSRVHNFSHLESIEVFTIRENVNLSEIFYAMENSAEKIPDGKDNAALTKYFEKTYPDLDFERVYTSDLKKMAKWFETLKSNNIEIKIGEHPVEEEPVKEKVPEPVAEEESKSPAKKKTATKKKTTTKKKTSSKEK